MDKVSEELLASLVGGVISSGVVDEEYRDIMTTFSKACYSTGMVDGMAASIAIRDNVEASCSK